MAETALIPTAGDSSKQLVRKAKPSPSPFKNVWTAADGGPGPADWRKQTDKRVHGLARRKGEMDPRNWGFQIHDELLTHPIWAEAKILPPKKAPKPKEDRKVKKEKKLKEKKLKEKEKEKEKKVKRKSSSKGLLDIFKVFGMGGKKKKGSKGGDAALAAEPAAAEGS